jgi:hypothetical protein
VRALDIAKNNVAAIMKKMPICTLLADPAEDVPSLGRRAAPDSGAARNQRGKVRLLAPRISAIGLMPSPVWSSSGASVRQRLEQLRIALVSRKPNIDNYAVQI